MHGNKYILNYAQHSIHSLGNTGHSGGQCRPQPSGNRGDGHCHHLLESQHNIRYQRRCEALGHSVHRRQQHITVRRRHTLGGYAGGQQHRDCGATLPHSQRLPPRRHFHQRRDVGTLVRSQGRRHQRRCPCHQQCPCQCRNSNSDSRQPPLSGETTYKHQPQRPTTALHRNHCNKTGVHSAANNGTQRQNRYQPDGKSRKQGQKATGIHRNSYSVYRQHLPR